MKKIYISLIAVFLLLFTGCPVRSIFPLYLEEDVIVDSTLVGLWIDADKEGYLEFQIVDSKKYRLTMYSVEGKDTIILTGILERIGKADFLDVSLSKVTNDDYVIPIHYFVKIWKNNDTLCCANLESDYLENMASRNNLNVPYLEYGNEILLTAQPKELQQFLLRIAGDEKAFDEGIKFIRIHQNR